MSNARAQTDRWTTHGLLQWISTALDQRGIDSPRLCAEMLVSHVIGCSRLALYTDAERPASPLERENLRALVARALKHEPIQYLVGQAWFFGMGIRVDPRVLIPRPSTVTLVEGAINHVRSHPDLDSAGTGVLIVDLCTGSGCVALALARHLPGARVVAVDISEPALEVARENARTLRLDDRIDFLQGDLLEPLRDFPATRAEGSVHVLVANPPYIPDHEWDAVEPNVKDHEPHLALRGGHDGLALVRPIIDHAPALMNPRGALFVEIAESTADEALKIALAVPSLTDARVLDDFEGRPRVLAARAST